MSAAIALMLRTSRCDVLVCCCRRGSVKSLRATPDFGMRCGLVKRRHRLLRSNWALRWFRGKLSSLSVGGAGERVLLGLKRRFCCFIRRWSTKLQRWYSLCLSSAFGGASSSASAHGELLPSSSTSGPKREFSCSGPSKSALRGPRSSGLPSDSPKSESIAVGYERSYSLESLCLMKTRDAIARGCVYSCYQRTGSSM